MNSISPGWITRLRKQNYIQRCAGTRLNRPYTVAEHGFHTANLFMLCSNEEGLEITAEELFTVMNHDVLETETGDLLYPAKNKNAVTQEAWKTIEEELTHDLIYARFTDAYISTMFHKQAHDLFKDCDMLELYLTIVEEMEAGNVSNDVVKIRNVAYKVLIKSRFDSIRRFVEE